MLRRLFPRQRIAAQAIFPLFGRLLPGEDFFGLFDSLLTFCPHFSSFARHDLHALLAKLERLLPLSAHRVAALQALFVRDVFARVAAMYEAEGLLSPRVPFADNARVLELVSPSNNANARSRCSRQSWTSALFLASRREMMSSRDDDADAIINVCSTHCEKSGTKRGTKKSSSSSSGGGGGRKRERF